MQRIALLSVSDKSGLVPFARELVDTHGYLILSTGGTARALEAAGIPVKPVDAHTGFPEILEGRVKTLHPRIHGGLLARRDSEDQMREVSEHAIDLIDLVAVNLYPFEKTVANPSVEFDEAIENIDIGGPSMLRSPAKNFASVTVLCDPADYSRVLEALGNEARLKTLRSELARKVFSHTAGYDSAISRWFDAKAASGEPDLQAISGFPEECSLRLPRAATLRYGENPHQQATLYGSFFEHFTQLQGKELSFNNLIDITAATYLIGEFERPTVAILKHTNPCGVASADDTVSAWDLAFATDQQAPFGGIIVTNHTVDDALAERIAGLFCEVVIAPGFSPEARERFASKKNLRLMEASATLREGANQDLRSVIGGVLLQDRDLKRVSPGSLRVVTERQPTAEEWQSLLFGWKVVKHVKSNAIVYARGERTLGIGAGQMSRVDSSRIAVWKAGEAGLSLDRSIIASDAFFPFPDGLLAAADAGAVAAIQPGGSVRDDAVIEAANQRGMAMVFTGVRHFRH